MRRAPAAAGSGERVSWEGRVGGSGGGSGGRSGERVRGSRVRKGLALRRSGGRVCGMQGQTSSGGLRRTKLCEGSLYDANAMRVPHPIPVE